MPKTKLIALTLCASLTQSLDFGFVLPGQPSTGTTAIEVWGRRKEDFMTAYNHQTKSAERVLDVYETEKRGTGAW